MKFFEELKKRNVYKAGVAYLVTSWLLLQIVDVVGPGLGWDESVTTLLLKILIVGFPIVLVLAWLYELTPKGFKRTGRYQEETVENKKMGRRMNQFIIGILVLALTLVLAERLFTDHSRLPVGNSEASIAILPFKNDSPDAENLYFCDGITEGVRENLSRIPALSVISRTSVEQFREDPPSVKEIAKELGVEYILEGSVLRLENRSVIRARLISAAEDRHIWSREYDRELEDIFAVLAEVTQNIAEELETTIAPDVLENIEDKPTDDLTAYDYYLQGREYMHQYEVSQQKSYLEKADALYEKALFRDSTFARALVERTRIFREKHQYEFYNQPQLVDSMRYLCDKAVSLDSYLADAYWVRGAFYDDFLYDIPGATKDLNRALELNPSHVEATGQLAVLNWAHHRKIIPALRLYRKVEKLEHSPEVLYGTYITLSQLYWDLWEHEKGYSYLDKALPYNSGLKGLKAWFHIQLGRYSDAIELMQGSEAPDALGFFHLLTREYEKALRYYQAWEVEVQAEGIQGPSELESWHRYGQVLAGLGREKEAREMMEYQLELNEKLQKNFQRAHVVYYETAGIYSFLGESDLAIEYLKKFDSVNRWDDGKLHFIQRDPQFDNIRNQESFKAIIEKRMGEIYAVREEVARLEAEGKL
jgi:TolB-like protein